MKKIFIVIHIAIFGSFNIYASTKKITLEQVSKSVTKQNYKVLETAQKLYQRKENIKFAKKSLLPKLNLWNILKIPGVFANPLSIGDIIQDVAPFLVPSNWFKVSKEKHLFKAEKEQYRSLWANEVNTAKMLFVSAYQDQQLNELIEEKTENYKEILEMVNSWNIFGGGSPFAYNMIKDRYLALTEDRRTLKNLLYSEGKELQYLMGTSVSENVEFVTPKLLKLKDSKKIRYDKIIPKVLEASPELSQYRFLLESVDKVKSGSFFSILGTSTYSIGEGNGAFDNIPLQDGLGFGMSSSIEIKKSEIQRIQIQQRAAVETIKKQVLILVNEYNSLIDNYDFTLERLDLAQETYDSLQSYLILGGKIEALEMMDILDNLYFSKVMKISYETRFSLLVEKIKRLTFSDDYSGPVNY